MATKSTNFTHEFEIEFLKAIHDEKTKAQEERATYITSKFAFITGLFGLGALKIGEISFAWLLYFVPIVAVGYDLYIRATDLSIKKMGAFLRNLPASAISEVEKDWETFSATYRDKLAQLATSLFTSFIILAAAIYIVVQEGADRNQTFWIIFIGWLLVSLGLNWALWKSHRNQIRKLDNLITESSMSENANPDSDR